MDSFIEIGNRIMTERKRRKMSREQLAEFTNLSVYYIGQIERGETKMSVNTLSEISDCLNLSFDYLLRGQLNNNDVKSNVIKMLETCSDSEAQLAVSLMETALLHVRQFTKTVQKV